MLSNNGSWTTSSNVPKGRLSGAQISEVVMSHPLASAIVPYSDRPANRIVADDATSMACLPWGAHNDGYVFRVGEWVMMPRSRPGMETVIRPGADDALSSFRRFTATNHVVIPAKQFAVLHSVETVHLPRDISVALQLTEPWARFGLSMTPFGIGGTTEPGHIQIPVYNCTDATIHVPIGCGIVKGVFEKLKSPISVEGMELEEIKINLPNALPPNKS